MKKLITTLSTIFINIVPCTVNAHSVEFESGKGVILESNDGNNRLATRLRLQILNTTTSGDEPVRDIFQLRRARVVFTGHFLTPDNKLKLELALSPRDMGVTDEGPARTPILDWYLDFKQFDNLNLRLGQYKTPLSRERVISSGNLSLVDRSIVNREFTTDRDVGFTLYSKNLFGLDKKLRYYASITANQGRDARKDNKLNLMYIGRIEVLPLGNFNDYSYGNFRRNRKPKLSLGLGYAFIDEAKRERGILGDILENPIDYHFGSTDVMFKYRGITLHSEAMLRTSENGSNRNGWGIFGQTGFMLPSSTLSFADVELAGRYGTNQAFDDSSLPKKHELVGGVNLFMQEHPVKLQADVGHLWSANYKAGENVIRVQLQAGF